MSIKKAEGKFKEAMLSLRSMNDLGLFHMNEGLVLLCGAIEKIDSRLAELDKKMAQLSKQAEKKKK